MRLPIHIKAKPSLPPFLDSIPVLSLIFNKTAQGIFGNVYVPQNIYENLKSSHPNPYHVSLLIHEETHLKRQKEMGTFIWVMKYLFIPAFRLHEEIVARQEQMKYLKQQKLSFPIEQQARFLASWVYLWPATYEVVLKELKKAREEV